MDRTVAQGRTAFALTLLAVVYSSVLIAWAVESPVSAPLVSQALVVSLLMWGLLHHRCTAGGRAVTYATFGLATVFFVYSLLGMLSIAAGALPAALALLIAAALTPSPAR